MNDLLVIEDTTVLSAFSGRDGLDPLIKQATDLVESFEHDMSTPGSRMKTASLANKVAKFKVRVDGMGKELVSEWKSKSKAVDINRKKVRDALDALKIGARKPLTEWEEDTAKKFAEDAARLAADKLREEVETAHEFALLMNDGHDRLKAEKEAKIENERIEAEKIETAARTKRENQIKIQAAEEATRLAEQKAKEEVAKIERDKQDAIERQIEAKNKAAQAERDQIAAEERLKINAELSEKARIEAEKNARIDAEFAAENARREAIQRLMDEAQKESILQEKRQTDKKHTAKIMRAAKEALMEHVMEPIARDIVLDICNNKIPHVSINF